MPQILNAVVGRHQYRIAACAVVLLLTTFESIRAQHGPPPGESGNSNMNGPANSNAINPAQRNSAVDRSKVKSARSDLNDARTELSKARIEMTQTTMRLKAAVASDPRLLAAAAKVQAAKADSDAAAGDVLSQLNDRPDYLAALSQLNRVDQISLTESLADGAASTAFAERRLQAKLSVATLKSAALAADARARTTHALYLNAASTYNELHAALTQKLHADDAWISAKQKLDDAVAKFSKATDTLKDAEQTLAEEQAAASAQQNAGTSSNNVPLSGKRRR